MTITAEYPTVEAKESLRDHRIRNEIAEAFFGVREEPSLKELDERTSEVFAIVDDLRQKDQLTDHGRALLLRAIASLYVAAVASKALRYVFEPERNDWYIHNLLVKFMKR